MDYDNEFEEKSDSDDIKSIKFLGDNLKEFQEK
jgi:hypothetical protein